MADVPDDLHYTDQHEWIRVDGDEATIGITAFAADALGDVVYVQLPAVGDTVAAGAIVGEIESTKSVGEVFAPVAGEVLAVNDALESSPELINSDPYGEGWIFRVRPGVLPVLLTADEYRKLTER